MGILERKSREKEERRNLILEKAKDLILEKGIGSFSMQDIADAAELSKATLYLYFQSKEAILGEILDEAMSAFIAYVKARIAQESSGLGALRALWTSFLGVFGESSDLFMLIGIIRHIAPAAPLVSPGPGDPTGDPMRRMRELIAQVLAWGVKDGSLDPSLDPGALAKMVILIAAAIIDNIARLPREARDSRLVHDEMKATFELLLRGFAAPGTDRALLGLSLDGKEA